ncbi:hypothetical protein DPMN_090479, partial [Dreissena polymorpha]
KKKLGKMGPVQRQLHRVNARLQLVKMQMLKKSGLSRMHVLVLKNQLRNVKADLKRVHGQLRRMTKLGQTGLVQRQLNQVKARLQQVKRKMLKISKQQGDLNRVGNKEGKENKVVNQRWRKGNIHRNVNQRRVTNEGGAEKNKRKKE